MWSGWRIATAASEASSLVYLGLGSNVGDRRAHLAGALRALLRLGPIEAVSAVYESEPVGPVEQPEFWNMVVRIRTSLRPAALLQQLKSIEQELGREPALHHGPRAIDIDILLYGDLRVLQSDLTIPHAALMDRAFVLRPLVELDPWLMHPGTGQRLAKRLEEGSFERIERLFPGTELLTGTAQA